MKLGTESEDINGLSFHIQRGWSGPESSTTLSQIIHEFIDKSIEVLDYGNRVKQEASFSFIDIPKTDYLSLVEYLETKVGLPLKITEENTGENVFTETNAFTEYYVYLKGYSKTGEVDFSTTRARFEVSLDVVFIGENSTDKQNIDDSSLIDVLIEVDTLRAKISEPETPIEGDRWLDIESSSVKIWTGSGWAFLQNLPSNSSTYNYNYGKFYWSLFSDITYKTTTPDSMDGDYKSGLILKDSLSMPSKSIRISDGPSIAYKNGFSFKIRNNDKFWKFITDNGIALFGAKVTLYIYNKSMGNYYLQKIATGLNNTNSFGYGDYNFQCEPITLNSDPKFNNSLISENNARYTGINPKNSKKVPYKTFGNWELAKLQDVSIEESVLNVRVKRVGDTKFIDSFKFTAYTDRTIVTNGKYKTLYIYKTGSGKELCEFTAEQITEINDSGQFIVSVLYDTNIGTDNKDKIIKIESISDETTFYKVTLKDGLEPGDTNSGARPSTNDNLACVIQRNGYQYQIDENLCSGFKVYNNSVFSDGLKIYGLNEKGTAIEEIPYTGLESNSDNNKLILSPEITSNKTKAYVYENVTKGRIYNEFNDHGSGSKTFGDLFPGEYFKNGTWYTKTNLGSTNNSVIALKENSAIRLYNFPINHTPDDLNFLKSKSVKLALNIDIESYVRPYTVPVESSEHVRRVLPAGFKIYLRAKKYDGTYIYGDTIGVNWQYEVSQESLALQRVQSSTKYKPNGYISIKNTPDDGGFNDVNDIQKNWSYYCALSVPNRATRPNSEDFVRHGDYIYIQDLGTIDKVLMNGSTVSYEEDVSDTIENGEIILIHGESTSINSQINYGGNVAVKKFVDGALVNAVPNVDFRDIQNLQGKDLFDLSPLFGEIYIWDSIEALELFFVNEDFSQYQYQYNFPSSEQKNVYYFWGLEVVQKSLNNAIRIFAVTEKELIERPLYTACFGESIKTDGEIGTPAGAGIAPIFKNVLAECYGVNVNQDSIDALALIRGMEWRKQFYSTISANQALKDLLESSWSVAFFDKDDKINIKSLNEKDYPTPTFSISDSDILSISDVKMRNSDEIFQRFKVNYNFYPPSMDSRTINKYQGEIYTDKNSTDIDNESKLNLQRSSNLFLNENTLERELEYIYQEKDAKFISKQMVNWHVYNSWEVTLEISISEILSGSTLEIMDYIKFKSHFYTNNEDVFGFITEIEPDIYKGKVKLTLYIPRPKGQLGPFRDPFNDALRLVTRNISSWTMANGKINDAGRLSTRGTITEKDAIDTGFDGDSLNNRNFNN